MRIRNTTRFGDKYPMTHRGIPNQPLWLYKTDSRKKREDQTEVDNATDKEESRHIICRFCHHKITLEKYKIEIDGQFQHTFLNPEGHMYRIGCFNQADGTISYGDDSTDWTWFKGYSWRVTVCEQCMSHVGWLYDSGKGNAFFGLILDALN